MPTSNWQNISHSVGLIRQWMPGSVLDVGCGFGRWGALCREFLDVWEGRPYPEQWTTRIDGIEGFEGYVNDVQRTLYSNVYVEDARTALPRLGAYDLIILGDVVEHFEKGEALRLLAECCGHLTDDGRILVLIPLGPDWPQDDVHGNDLERHRSTWSAEELEAVGGDVRQFRDYRDRPFASVVLDASSRDALTGLADRAVATPVVAGQAASSGGSVPEVPTRVLNLCVLTYNALDHTKRCLESLLAHTRTPFNLFVLDNASTDGTPEWLAGLSDERLHVRASDENHGVPGGRNRLLQWAFESLGEDGYVVFLDNDVVVEEGWEDPFLEVFERRQDVGIAGSAGHPIEIQGEERVLHPSPPEAGRVDLVSGFSFWVRARTAREVGFFDEALGLFWHEDDDYCLRAIGEGHEVFYVPAPKLHHAEHQSGVALSEESAERSRKNQAYLVDKWKRLGLVDEQGWVRRFGSPVPVDGATYRRLTEAQGRERIPRDEIQNAIWSLERLLFAADPVAEYQNHRQPLSPTFLELFGASRERAVADGDEHWSGIFTRLSDAFARHRYSVQARREIEVVRTASDGSEPGPSKVCSARDWNDPMWASGVLEILGDTSSENYDLRHRQTWEYGQILHGLRQAGCVSPESKGLVVGAGNEGLMWKLSSRVAELDAVDLYDARSEQLFGVPPDLPEDPERYAPEDADLSRIGFRRMDGCSLDYPDGTFDFAYAASVLQHCGGRDRMRRLVSEMIRVVKPGGIIAVSTDVVLNPVQVPDRLRLAEIEAFATILPGAECIGTLGVELDDETLEGFGDSPETESRRPHFLHRAGPMVLTSFVLFLEKVGAPDVMGSEPTSRTPEAAPRPEVATPAAPRKTGEPSRGGTHIGIDVRTLNYANSVSRGIGHYTIYHLQALFRLRPDWSFTCFGEGPVPEVLNPLLVSGNVSYRELTDYRPGEVDLVHLPDPMNLSFGYDSPFRVFHEERTTVLFHDLIPLRFYWHTWSDEQRAVYHDRLEQMRKSGSVLLTNSEFTRQDALHTLGLPEDRVHAVLAGINRSESGSTTPDPAAVARVREALGARGPIFLHVGAVDPHKNFDTVLEAFLAVRKHHEASLVVVGRLDGDLAEYARRAEAARLKDVIFTGFISREDLEILYHEACALVFLSRYEGFGFPALEAMAQGCPVIASRAASLPEVVGDSAMLVETHDTLEAARAMERLVRDADARKQERERGLERARSFSWEATAKRTLQIWEPMLTDRGSGGAAVSASMITPESTSSPPRGRSVVWQAPLLDPTGYGEEAREFALGLDGAGESVRGIPLLWSKERVRLPEEQRRRLRALVTKSADPRDRMIHVCHSFPPMFTPHPYVLANVGRTTFETDRIPEGWAERCRQMDEIWVPTDFNRETFARSGVPERLLHKVPAFVDTDAFHPDVPVMEVEGRKGFNFLSVFDWTLRKGWDVLLRAYVEEFSEEEDVCLFLKVSSSLGWTQEQIGKLVEAFVRRELGRDPERIPDLVLLPDLMSREEMPSLFAACDAFVMPSRGEGWGRPYMEAMATGKPVIGTSWSGNLEFMNSGNSYLIDHQVVDVPRPAIQEARWFAGHRWAEPSKDHLRALLREVMTHPDRAREVGRRARSDVVGRFSPTQVLSRVRERLDALS